MHFLSQLWQWFLPPLSITKSSWKVFKWDRRHGQESAICIHFPSLTQKLCHIQVTLLLFALVFKLWKTRTVLLYSSINSGFVYSFLTRIISTTSLINSSENSQLGFCAGHRSTSIKKQQLLSPTSAFSNWKYSLYLREPEIKWYSPQVAFFYLPFLNDGEEGTPTYNRISWSLGKRNSDLPSCVILTNIHKFPFLFALAWGF